MTPIYWGKHRATAPQDQIHQGLGGANKLLHRTHGFDNVGRCLRIEKW